MKNKSIIIILISFLLIFSFMTALPASAYDVTQSYDRVANDLEELRSLKFKKRVPFSVKDRPYMTKYLMKLLKEELPPEKQRQYEASLKTFGFVPENFDAMDFLGKLYSEQVAGLYDYNTKSMFVVKDSADVGGMEEQVQMMRMMGMNPEDMYLIHEMQHSLQDQYFDLEKMIKTAEKKHNDDYLNSIQAVIEGDASAVMFYYMFETMSKSMGGQSLPADLINLSDMREAFGNAAMMADMEIMDNAPLYYQKTMLFPYIDGMIFVDALKKKGGWTMVNRAFKNPPKSTEQVLHPEKYFAPDNPVIISFKNLPQKTGGWAQVEKNTLGELLIDILFEQFIAGQDNGAASQGWDGDRYVIYGKNNETFLVWYTTWDSENDSKEFMSYYLELLKKKYPDIAWKQTLQGKAYLAEAGGNYCYVGKSGNDVLVLEKVPPKMIQGMIDKGWKVGKTAWN